jgi:peroxiredoxin
MRRDARTTAAMVWGCALALLATAGWAQPPAAMNALGMRGVPPSTSVPDVTLPTLAGAPVAMKSLRGKTVLLNFFATWCKGCLWEMPLLEDLYQAYRDRGFVVLAVSVDQHGANGARSLVAEKKLTFPVALDPEHDVAQKFKVTGIPTTILIGSDGDIKGVAHGPRDWNGKEARALIASLLPAPQPGAAR